MMTSVNFLEFFTQLSLLAKESNAVSLSKSNRLQIYDSAYITIPTYNISYTTGGETTSLTIGELAIAPQNFVYFLYLANEFEIEPDGLATGENYDTALNFFQETYVERRTLLMESLLTCKNRLELSKPELVFSNQEA